MQNFGSDLPADVSTRLWATQRAASTSAVDSTSTFAARAHSQVTVFDGDSHLTLLSRPDAVTAVIDQAIASVH